MTKTFFTSIVLMILGLVAYFIIFIIGIGFGQSKSQLKLEQKLCELKQYEYCTKEELLKLKTIK